MRLPTRLLGELAISTHVHGRHCHAHASAYRCAHARAYCRADIRTNTESDAESNAFADAESDPGACRLPVVVMERMDAVLRVV